MTSKTLLQVNTDLPTVTIEPWHAYCPKHGKVFNWVEVEHEPDYQHNGHYCQKCYVENVLARHCGRLSDVKAQ